jgi:large subunit ribosomal protein L4
MSMATTKKVAKKKVAKKAAPEVSATSLPLYTAAGKEKGTVELPQSVFGIEWNKGLIHQVVTAMEANARTSVAHVKDRGEVRGGGRKPWQQKGTGRSRHGSSRSPIWIGGGVTHGPRNEKVYGQRINKKMRTKALAISLSQKVRDNEVVLIDSLGFDAPKSKQAKAVIESLAKHFPRLGSRTNAALIAVPRHDAVVLKSFRNFGNISVVDVASMNPVEVLRHKHIVIVSPEDSFATLTSRLTA